MTLQSFETISSNIDIIQLIFELLTFEEQLLLANVSQQLQYVFKHFIWKQTYRKVKIIKCHDDKKCQINKCQCSVVITNETHMNNIKLTANALKEFLNIYAYDIEDLTENRGSALDLQHFQNLLSLTYCNMKITNHHLQLIAQYCPKLEKLQIYYCQNEYEKYLIKIEEDLKLNTLIQMKSLQYLTLHNFNLYKLKYEDFLKIVNKLKLKYLNLNVVDINDDDDHANVNIVKLELTNTLEELIISGSFASSYWSTNSNIFLRNFENLKSLTIRMVEFANQHVIKTLAKTCTNLETLKINRTNFKNIQEFSVLHTLTELNFNACCGLTQDNLKEILGKLKLNKFSSTQTQYEGTFENFYISASIKSLNIDDIKTIQFKSLYEFNNNLKELTWYGSEHDEQTEILLNCPNLQQLEIVSGYLSIDNLLQLKSLQILTLTQPLPSVTWSYLVALLKHPSLQNLKLTGLCHDLISEEISENLYKNSDINLQSLEIPLDLFECGQRFWFNLLESNRRIQLKCFSSKLRPFDLQFFHKLLKMDFPRNLKSFQIAGFKVDCNDLRINFLETTDQIFHCIGSIPGAEFKLHIIFEYV